MLYGRLAEMFPSNLRRYETFGCLTDLGCSHLKGPGRRNRLPHLGPCTSCFARLSRRRSKSVETSLDAADTSVRATGTAAEVLCVTPKHERLSTSPHVIVGSGVIASGRTSRTL
jgi:hypothetical protein